MKYVFWIHSSTSYYMAKAIIAKENLDCHNVVYLIDRKKPPVRLHDSHCTGGRLK